MCNRVVGLHRAFRPDFVTRNFWGWRRYPFDHLERYVDRRLWEVDRELTRALEDVEKRFFPFRTERWQPERWGWRTLFESSREVPVEVAEDGSRKMVIKVDVARFKPEEVKVTVGEGMVSIRAKHEEASEDGAQVYRKYVKEFTLPEDVDLESLRSYLDDGGMLRIEAQLPAIEAPAHKEIPIQKISKEKPGKDENKN